MMLEALKAVEEDSGRELKLAKFASSKRRREKWIRKEIYRSASLSFSIFSAKRLILQNIVRYGFIERIGRKS